MPSRHTNANANQRARRVRRPRIDYYPSPAALAAIEARRDRYHPTNNYSGILDSIIAEWCRAQNPKKREVERPVAKPHASLAANQPARAGMTPDQHPPAGPELIDTSRACAPARMTPVTDTRTPLPLGQSTAWEDPHLRKVETARVICGARRRGDGQPCEALSVPGKRRCKWHGGCSTGPRSDQGRRKALENLRQFRGKAGGNATNSNGRPSPPSE